MKPKPLASLNHFTVPVVRMRYSCVTMGPDSTYWTSRLDTRGLSDAPHVGHDREKQMICDGMGPLGQPIEDLGRVTTAARTRIAWRHFHPTPLPGPTVEKPRGDWESRGSAEVSPST